MFLVAATTETADELRAVVDAVAAEQVIVVCVRATPDTVAARIATREPDAWPGKAALIALARQLARTIPAIEGLDLVVKTEARDAVAVACDVRDALRVRGLLDLDR